MQVRSPLSQTQALLISILALGEFSRGALIISILPTYVLGPVGASLLVVGWATSAHYFFDTVSRGPSGWLVDRIGPPRVLTIGMIIEIIALFGIMHARHPELIIGFVALLGVGTATHWPAVVTGINRLTDPDRRASVMGMVFAGWIGASGMGPILANFLLGGHDRVAFLLLIFADAIALVITLVVHHPNLSHIHRVRLPISGRVKIIWPMRFVLPGMFIQNMTLGLLLPIIRPFTSRVLHFSALQFAELFIGGGVFTVLLLVPMGRFTDRWGLKFPLVGGFFLAGIMVAGIGFVRNFYMLMAVAGMAGLSYAMILPSWNALVAGLIPKEHEGWLWGFFMTIEGFGMAVGPVIGTRLFAMASWGPFLVSGVILVVMGAFYTIYTGRHGLNIL